MPPGLLDWLPAAGALLSIMVFEPDPIVESLVPMLLLFFMGLLGLSVVCPLPGPPTPPAPPVDCAHDAVVPASARVSPSAITPRYFFIWNFLC